MQILRFVIWMGWVSIALTACSQNKDRILLAQVGNYKLYLDDIPVEKIQPAQDEDSIARLYRFVNSWAEEKVLMIYAENEMVLGKNEEIDKLIETYRRNLIQFELERTWLNEYRDTLVSAHEIESYYKQNKDNFLLRNNIVKIRYIKLRNDLKPVEINKVQFWLNNPGTRNDSLLRNFAEEKAENFYLEDQWLFYSDLLKEVPLATDVNQQRFLQTNRNVQLKEEDYIYMIYFVDYKIKDEISPLELEKENIEKYILIKRKSEWISNKRRTLIEEAHEKGSIQLWLQ